MANSIITSTEEQDAFIVEALRRFVEECCVIYSARPTERKRVADRFRVWIGSATGLPIIKRNMAISISDARFYREMATMGFITRGGSGSKRPMGALTLKDEVNDGN